VGLVVEARRRLVVGVEMDWEAVRGVEELGEQREVRAAPPLADDRVRVRHHDLVERLPGQDAVPDRRPGVAVIADLPSFGDDPIRHAGLTEPLRDEAGTEGVGADVERQLERVPGRHSFPPEARDRLRHAPTSSAAVPRVLQAGGGA
jgi:hypothetical protein